MAEEDKTEQPAAEEGAGIAVEIEKEPGAPASIPEEELNKLTSVTDDEIAHANEEAKKAVKGLRRAFQVERRKAEQWSRDAATAGNLAEQLYRENQQLRQNVTRSESALIDQALARAEAQLAHAKSNYKQALAINDADLIVAANEDQARAVAEVDRLKILKPAALAAGREAQQETEVNQAPRPQAPPPVSERTRSWTAAHPWFNVHAPPGSKDREMTEFAMRQHNHLFLDGITEENNPDLYWRTIEDRLRERYPENSGSARPTEGHARPVAVTGGTRSNGSPSSSVGGKRTVRLTESQVRIASRLGLTPEQYAVQLVKDEQEQERSKRSVVQ